MISRSALRNILVYVDPRPESRLALEHAAHLARKTGASIAAVDVIEDPGRWRTRSDVLALSADERQRLLEDLAAPVRHAGLDVKVSVRRGRASVELIRCVLEDHHDLVIKAAKGRVDGRRSFFGTTAMHLIRKCPAPVWLVGPEPLPRRPRILAALDPGDVDDAISFDLAQRVLGGAQKLAERIDGEVHALHAFHLTGEGLLRRRVTAEEFSRLVTEDRAIVRQQLERVFESVPGPLPADRVHLVHERPETGIPDFVRDRSVDVIVIGSVGRAGIAGLLIGEMAEEILGRVDCSVLCVKPRGFVSPVRPPRPERGPRLETVALDGWTSDPRPIPVG